MASFGMQNDFYSVPRKWCNETGKMIENLAAVGVLTALTDKIKVPFVNLSSCEVVPGYATRVFFQCETGSITDFNLHLTSM